MRRAKEYRASAAKKRSGRIKAKSVPEPNIAAKTDVAEPTEVLTAVVPKKTARTAKKAAKTDEGIIEN